MVGFEGLILQVSPLLINILLIKVVLLRRNKWRLQALVREVVPGEIAQPRVLLHLLRTIGTQSILRLSLYHLKEMQG